MRGQELAKYVFSIVTAVTKVLHEARFPELRKKCCFD